MGIKQIGPLKWAYDIHVRGAKERPRGVFEGTKTKAQSFVRAEIDRLSGMRSLKFDTVGDVLRAYLEDRYKGTAKYRACSTPFDRLMTRFNFIRLAKFDFSFFKVELDEMAQEETQYKEKPRPDTLNGYITIMNAAFENAKEAHGLPKNPIAGFRRFPAENRQRWTLSAKEVDAVLQVAEHTAYWPILSYLKHVPARISELTTLKNPSDVYLADRYLLHPDEHNKSGEGRQLPIPESWVGYFENIPKESPWVFFYPPMKHRGKFYDYRPITRTALLTWLYRTGEKLKIPRINIHAFRRTGAVRWLEAGVDLITLSEVTGHTDLRMLKERYLPLVQKHKLKALAKVEMALGSVDRMWTEPAEKEKGQALMAS
jgi:integrase